MLFTPPAPQGAGGKASAATIRNSSEEFLRICKYFLDAT